MVVRRIHWKYNFDLSKKVNTDDISDEAVGKTAKEIEKVINKILAKNDKEYEKYNEQLTELADSFNFIHFLSDKDETEREEYDFENENLHEHLNFSLNELYDIFDDNKFVFLLLS